MKRISLLSNTPGYSLTYDRQNFICKSYLPLLKEIYCILCKNQEVDAEAYEKAAESNLRESLDYTCCLLVEMRILILRGITNISDRSGI
jgi:hypothetical protein